MDGSSRNTIVDTRLTWPNGITLDLILQRIFWVDAHEDVLESAKFDGTDRRLIMSGSSSLRHPFSVTTFEDYVYYSDWTLKAVYRANRFTGGGSIKIYEEMNVNVNTVQVYHPLRQPDSENRCTGLEGCCSYLCVPVPTISGTISKVSCSCPGRNLSEPEDVATRTEMATETAYHDEEEPDASSTSQESTTATAKDNIEHAEEYASTTVEMTMGESTTTQIKSVASDEEGPGCNALAKAYEDCSGSILAAVLLTLSVTSVLTVLVTVAYSRFGSRGRHRRNFVNPIYPGASEDFILSSYETTEK